MRLLLLLLPLGLFAEIVNTDNYTISCKVEHIDVTTFVDGKVETYGFFKDGLKKGDTVYLEVKLEEEKWKNIPELDKIILNLSHDDKSQVFFLDTFFSSTFELKDRFDGGKYVSFETLINERELDDSGTIVYEDGIRSYNIFRYYKDDYQFFYHFYTREQQANYYLNCINAKGLTTAIDKFFIYTREKDSRDNPTINLENIELEPETLD